MTHMLTFLLLTSFLVPVCGAPGRYSSGNAQTLRSKKNRSLNKVAQVKTKKAKVKKVSPQKRPQHESYTWRRVTADPQKSAETQARREQETAEMKAADKKKEAYRTALAQAKKHDLDQFEKDKMAIRTQALQEDIEPFTFVGDLDARYFLGTNLQLFNANNECDDYSFLQYTFDTGVYVHPHTHYLEQETLEFKAMARMKANAGDVSRFTRTAPSRTKIGWAVTELQETRHIDRLLFWMRDLWLKYYFDLDRTSFITAGYFPYTIGHGIVLGDGFVVGEPVPGQYTTEDIDQYRPGILLSGTFKENQFIYDLYLSILENASDTFDRTATFVDAQSMDKELNVTRGSYKSNYLVAAQVKFQPHTSKNTACTINPYIVFNHNNHASIEFTNDATSRLLTVGVFGEWENGPVTFSAEAAHNFGKQDAKWWDRNAFHFAAVNYNTHLLYINPTIIGPAFYPTPAVSGAPSGIDYSVGAIDRGLDTPGSFLTWNTNTQAQINDNTNYTDSIGVMAGGFTQDFSREYANGTIFGVPTPDGSTPQRLIYKNSYDRFRKPYTNLYRGWFVMGDVSYKFREWRLGGAMGIVSGDNSPNDSHEYVMATRREPGFTYKDYDKSYKGFVGTNQMFRSKSIRPQFIHEAEKLNSSIALSTQLSNQTITNLLFLGAGLQHHSIYNHKHLYADINLVAYAQDFQNTKGTNLPYPDYQSFTYTAAQQADAAKPLDTYLGFEFNASVHYKITHDLDISCSAAIFVPGKYYSDAEGKYMPIQQQVDLVVGDVSGIQDKPEQFDITLGKDTALLLSAGIKYSFDSLILKKKQQLYKPKNHPSI
jgi:hypothetical protein